MATNNNTIVARSVLLNRILSRKFSINNTNSQVTPQCFKIKPLQQQSQANYATKGDSMWFVDSGAINHVTFDFGNLILNHDYDGIDSLKISNGSHLSISHIGSNFLVRTVCQCTDG